MVSDDAEQYPDGKPAEVLILVLMEYGLGHLLILCISSYLAVLILVLMEYGLGLLGIRDDFEFINDRS